MELEKESDTAFRRPHNADRMPIDHHAGARQRVAPAVRSVYAAGSHTKRPSRPHNVSITTTAGFVSHITPPSTPTSPPPDSDMSFVNQALFHNYLRALHAFDPATNPLPAEDASLSTVRIKPGDLILVHVIHANGWADGTILNTGARGWLPTNYCEAYDHPYLRNLLNAMTQFWDLLGASEDASLSTFVRQDYIRGLIAGVRYLLERADCLHRDAPTVRQHAGVRRMRKGLLADLSSLVGIAKRLQETIGEAFAAEVIHVLLDDLISKAFKVVTRAVGFTDVWTQEASSGNIDVRRQSRQHVSAASQSGPLAIDTQTLPDKETSHAIDSAIHLPEPEPEQDATAGADQQPDARDSRVLRRSMVFTPPDGMAAHRLSLVTKEKARPEYGILASEQLAKVHDICISHIAAFIGLHLHSRPSAELVATTERLVTACRDMLEIVDEVYAHDPQRSMPVQQVKQDFEARLEELAKSTKAVFRFSDSPDEDVVMLHDQHQHLITVGTSLIRNTGDCVVKTRQLIEQIGDFELKSSAGSPTKMAVDIPARIDIVPSKGAHEMRPRSIIRHSADMKMLPPPPPVPRNDVDMVDALAVPLPSPTDTLDTTAFPMPPGVTMQKALPLLPPAHRPRSATHESHASSMQSADVPKGHSSLRCESQTLCRKDSIGMSIAGSTETYFSSLRDSGTTAVSQPSTRATTPEQGKDLIMTNAAMMGSFASISSMRSLVTEDSMDVEAQLLQKTYVLELTRNKEGQITGGSLPALVEQLTTHDLTPDPQFVTAFFLTFRKFAEPRELAQALIHRFDYVGDGRTTGTPARLRLYNFFKGWLETYWNAEADKDALGEIRFFALHKLKQVLPQAGDRLVELTRRITEGYATGMMNGPLVSGVGKSSMSFVTQDDKDIPASNVTARQLNALRVATGGGAACGILDIDPVELARQITIMMMTTYCEIRPEELLSMDWSNPNTKKARNIRKMCLLNTDLANLVADTILAPDDAKKRATIIKHWSKIAIALLDLHNYDSIMSIMCMIKSSVVQRLRRTWELVSRKTKAKFDELDHVIDISKNYTALRRRLEAQTTACLPFLGIYLTDLTFVVAGNPKRREIPGGVTESGGALSVINFDLYMRIAKLVSHMQRFQAPYRLRMVPELQTWIEIQLMRMREGHDALPNRLHRRSTMVEPRVVEQRPAPLPEIREERAEKIERPKTPATSYVDLSKWYNLKSATFSIRTMPAMDSTEQQKRTSAH
ncbi:Putative ras-like guanine nucleotide exchange factor, SH3 domain, SH3-like domain superfamily [Septoria linicola]|uniref:Ras-like guanine nucleotide exchange factor, SH3 domain, SH3-like domain superfamily n=1 Tax=Septoria linicola TaxID=215465 RepID=A0A9Q9B6H9_9PEZI|nr:putative ras-like guanine nucleotide exchange factor, SH3 domain, SH3-like domain superfamily [Septoria linicola]USW58257.1 Putative ras-like guanine nucleotide exchange factor, SH3 domain, SH3-like domain superfamily [Septoria linicola]